MFIFDDGDRSDGSPMHRYETSYQFLNRVDRPYWARTRDILEDWITHYPAGHARRDMIHRLRSPNNDKHAAAFWELYLHESFLRDGWTVIVHPVLSGTTRQPDYLVRRGEDQIVVEATTVGRDTSEVGRHKRVQQVLAVIDSIHSPDFYVSVDYERIGPGAPPAKKLRTAIEAWLASLDVAQVRSAVAGGGWQAEPTMIAEPGTDWRLVLRAVPVREGVSRSAKTRTVGMEGPGEAVMVDHVAPFRRRLDRKATSYGEMSLTYVIAVLDLSEYPPQENDHARALYGTNTAWFDVATRREHSAFRAVDGFWSSGRKHASAVSGVLVTWELRPWTVAKIAPVLWRNPTPIRPLRAPSSLPWESRSLASDGISIVYSAAVNEPRGFFGLPPGWPGPERPFAP